MNMTQYKFCSHVSVRNWRALSAHDCSDLAALWSGVEVIFGVLGGDSLHFALNPNLHIRIKLLVNIYGVTDRTG